MTKRTEETAVLTTLQDLLIFQMASAGVPQAEIRKVVGVEMYRVSRVARLVKKSKKAEED